MLSTLVFSLLLLLPPFFLFYWNRILLFAIRIFQCSKRMSKSKWRGSPEFSGETRTRTERHVARARNNRNHHDGRHSGEALVGQLPDAAGPHPALQVRCPPKEFKDFAFRLNLGACPSTRRGGVVPGLASRRAEAALRGLPCLRPSPASALSDACPLCQPSMFSLSPFSPIPGAEALRAARERPRLSSRQAGGLASRARGARASWPGRPRVWPPRRTPP